MDAKDEEQVMGRLMMFVCLAFDCGRLENDWGEREGGGGGGGVTVGG